MARTIEYTTTSSRIKARVEGLDTAYSKNDRTVDWYLYKNNNLIDSNEDNSLSAGASYTSWVYFAGLSPDTTYMLEYVIYYDGGSVTDAYNITTDETSRPSNFYWDTAKTQGGSFNVTASEWNKLIDAVKDFHVYVKGGYNSTDYPMTKVASGDTFYASNFNEVRFAIGSISSTGISNKSKGNIITASDLNTLVNSLNSIN